MRDYTVNGMLFDFPSYNSNSIFFFITEIDLTKQTFDQDGYLIVMGVSVRYKDYIPGIILGRKIADKTVIQTLVTRLKRKVTAENYDYLFKRKFKLVTESSLHQSRFGDYNRVDLI